MRWQIDPVKHERHYMTLLAQLNEANNAFIAYYLTPSLDRSRRFTIRKTDCWLAREVRLAELTELLSTARPLSSGERSSTHLFI